jgi:uncharacterized protein
MARQRKSSGGMTVREAGLRGGEVRKAQLGPDGYARIGRKGGAKLASERGSAFFSEIGRKGGESRKQQLGPEGYARLGREKRRKAAATAVADGPAGPPPPEAAEPAEELERAPLADRDL